MTHKQLPSLKRKTRRLILRLRLMNVQVRCPTCGFRTGMQAHLVNDWKCHRCGRWSKDDEVAKANGVKA